MATPIPTPQPTSTPPAPPVSGAAPIADARRLLLGLAGAVAIGAAAGIGLGSALGWAPTDGRMALQPSAFLGASALAFGAVLGLAFLWPAFNRTPAKLGIMVLAASATRMMACLGLATAMLVVARPEPYAFFTALCAGFFASLVVESLWAMSALGRASAAGSSPATIPTTTPHPGVSAR